MPACCWGQEPGAAKPKPESAVLPPKMPIFSRSTTLLPSRAAVIAAHRAAPPDPTTTTSAAAGIGSSREREAWPRFSQAEGSWPAAARASFTALRYAMDVRVAPLTVSTSRVWFSRMSPLSTAWAVSPTLMVS